MYRTLRELEREALVFCEAQGAEFMLSRRRYAITTLGETYLELVANVLAQYRVEVERFFRLYERTPLQKVSG